MTPVKEINWYCRVCLVYLSLVALFASEVRNFALYIPATGISMFVLQNYGEGEVGGAVALCSKVQLCLGLFKK